MQRPAIMASTDFFFGGMSLFEREIARQRGVSVKLRI